LPYSGVDEKTPTGGAGIMVPFGNDGNIVMLAQGSRLNVTSNSKLVGVQELNRSNHDKFISHLPSSLAKDEEAAIGAKLKDKTWRFFRVWANHLPGLSKAPLVEARNGSAGKAEAVLKVLVVKAREVKIAIRPVKTKDNSGKEVSYTENAVDSTTMLNQMNRIWQPQANITFKVIDTSPALITDGLTADSRWAEITNKALESALVKEKIDGAELTMFLVKQAGDNRELVAGVTNAGKGIALISDKRSDTTMAHEAGHFLGALNESGKYSQEYGEHGMGTDLLMNGDGAGHKIPYSNIIDFNKRYRD